MDRSPLLPHFMVLSLNVSCYWNSRYMYGLILQGFLPYIGRVIPLMFHITAGHFFIQKKALRVLWSISTLSSGIL